MGNFNNLPSDITLDILTRLPTQSVLDCKLVCRPWRDLVCHHPSFSQIHLTRLNHSNDSGKLSFLVTDIYYQLYYFEYDEDNNELPIDSIRRINLTPPPPFRLYYNVLGSYNGLVCLCGWRDHTACICNPVTKEYVMLPELNRDCGDINKYIYWSSGFGYLPLTNEYKVVAIDQLRTDHRIVEVSVYTLGSSNGWRNVGRCFDTELCDVEHGVFVNGALHWVDKGGGIVFVFDLMEEKFRKHVSQPPLPLSTSIRVEYYTVGELGGVLYYAVRYYSQITKCTCFDVWLLKKKNNTPDMKEQVENEASGWSKVFTIPGREPLAFTKGGGLLWFDDRSLSIYDAIASTSKKLVDFSEISRISPHKNTLISLKELGEDDINIMESAENTESYDC